MKSFRFILCFFIIFALCLPMLSCAEMEQLDWTMNAYLLNGDGQIEGTYSVSVDGPIIHEDDLTRLKFTIHFPSDLGLKYYFPDNTGEYTNLAYPASDIDYYTWIGYLYDTNNADYCFAYFALCTEKQYLMVLLEGSEDHTLLASADPNVSVNEIKAYFTEFIDIIAAHKE